VVPGVARLVWAAVVVPGVARLVWAVAGDTDKPNR
jgi:hypothetical protein